MQVATASADHHFDIRRGLPILAFRLFIAFCILALLSASILVAGKVFGRSLVRAGHTASIQRFEIVVGNDVLSIAANMVRKEEQRHSGLANRVDLYVYWPAMSGFKDRLATAFSDIDPATSSIIFLSLMPRVTTQDMAGRFDAVYQNIMTGVAVDAGHGLKSHALSPDHGYINERIVYSSPDSGSGKRFVVRCQDTDAAAQTLLAPCETDIHVGETLTAQIRFPLRLLGNWQKLDVALPQFLNGLLVATEQ